MKNKTAWAEVMLGSHEGLDCLAALAASKKTLPKANKILDEAYPNLKSQLITQLKSKFGIGIIGRLSSDGL